MPDIFEALQAISNDRKRDPLAPITVVAPSHAAALQLRRRLAAHAPFAAVRFETLPRVAELLGAGRLAAAGRSPLARPIGDYAAELAGRESAGVLAGVGDLPGYARVLRQIFRRLRRGGIRTSRDLRVAISGHLGEMLRLYDRYRELTSRFYDEEDLLDAAAEAVRVERPGFLPDLGSVYYVPPGPQSAGSAGLLEALREVTEVTLLDEPAASASETFLIAPDPASEAQEAVRLTIEALESGVPLHEIAVFHGAAAAYGRLLREAFKVAGVTSVPLPGVPVAETRAGRGVLSLARLPEIEYSRTGTMDFLSVAPIREWLPAGTNGSVEHEATASWDKISREAMITRGVKRWKEQLESFAKQREVSAAEMDPTEYEQRIAIMEREAVQSRRLLAVIEALVGRLEPLRQPQPAEQFIAAFKKVVSEYIDSDNEGAEEALEEIDQLGTVGALGGEFTLDAFAESLGANLEARCIRPESIGNGVIIADYRVAAGMRFQRVILCGAFEGAFPPGPGTDAILDDRVWRALHAEHPYIQDAETRIERANEAVVRAVAAAGEGSLTWSAPAYESGGGREYFPAPAMGRAYSNVAGKDVTASGLRRTERSDTLRRPSSPLAVALKGPVLSTGELDLRRAVVLAQARRRPPLEHPRFRAVESLFARRNSAFSEWDGNLAGFDDPAWLEVQGAVSPTSLESYGTCGFKYFAKSLLKLQTVEEPEERQMMNAAERGTLIHGILEDFFIEQKANGRPRVGEAWTPDDLDRLTAIAQKHLDAAKASGLTGLDVFLEHEARSIRADLTQFLEQDTAFRQATGAVPSEFEVRIPPTEIVPGVMLRGQADRIDRTPDGKRAWVIDYKTGSAYGLDNWGKDPLLGGTKLQLPVYLAAVQDAEEATALYWYISRKAGFEQVEYASGEGQHERFQATLEAILAGIRSGAFPVVPGEENEQYNTFKNCGFCDFNRICSRRRDVEYAAKVEDAGMRPWHSVREAASPPEAAE